MSTNWRAKVSHVDGFLGHFTFVFDRLTTCHHISLHLHMLHITVKSMLDITTNIQLWLSSHTQTHTLNQLL